MLCVCVCVFPCCATLLYTGTKSCCAIMLSEAHPTPCRHTNTLSHLHTRSVYAHLHTTCCTQPKEHGLIGIVFSVFPVHPVKELIEAVSHWHEICISVCL